MGLGKIARGAGKVGLLIEGATYAVRAGAALIRFIRGRDRLPQADQPSPEPDEDLRDGDQRGARDQQDFSPEKESPHPSGSLT